MQGHDMHKLSSNSSPLAFTPSSVTKKYAVSSTPKNLKRDAFSANSSVGSPSIWHNTSLDYIGLTPPPKKKINYINYNSPVTVNTNFTPSKYPAGYTTSPRQRRIFSTKDCDECGICSDETFRVNHPHFSVQKQFSNRKNQLREIHCRLCRFKHTTESERLNLVLSSSTVHNLWLSRSYQPEEHIDFDTIIGGRIHDIHASFLYQYYDLKTPMDILLVCGVNNIPTSDSSSIIIQQFESLIKTIKRHSQENNHRVGNRIVLCTVLYAPKFCDRSLPPQFDMKDKVRKVNNWIESWNTAETGLHLKLHLNGVVGDPDKDIEGTDIIHRYEDWKEPQVSRKLHLTNNVKDKVALQVLQLFRDIKNVNPSNH